MHTLRFSLCQIIFCGMAISQVNRDYLVRPFAGGALPDGIPGLSADLDPFLDSPPIPRATCISLPSTWPRCSASIRAGP